MAAPAMSYLICSMGLVVLILVMPYFYSLEVDGVARRAAEVELAEIADYTSNTLANLCCLANSTGEANSDLTKQLLYLPPTVQGSFYTLTITVADDASKVTATLRDKPSISADSWLVPGLKVDETRFSVEITGRTVVAGCFRSGQDYYVWLGVEE